MVEGGEGAQGVQPTSSSSASGAPSVLGADQAGGEGTVIVEGTNPPTTYGIEKCK